MFHVKQVLLYRFAVKAAFRRPSPSMSVAPSFALRAPARPYGLRNVPKCLLGTIYAL